MFKKLINLIFPKPRSFSAETHERLRTNRVRAAASEESTEEPATSPEEAAEASGFILQKNPDGSTPSYEELASLVDIVEEDEEGNEVSRRSFDPSKSFEENMD